MSFESVRQDHLFNPRPPFVPRITYAATPPVNIKKPSPRTHNLFSSPKLPTKFVKPNYHINYHAPIY